MKNKETKRKQIHKIIVGALRETIRVHGPIIPLLIGSAAKRITGTLVAKDEKEDDERTNSGCS